MEELTDNAEEHEDEASKVSEQKLGKLQYKVLLITKFILKLLLINFYKNMSFHPPLIIYYN